MRKAIALVTSVLMLGMFAGCSKQSPLEPSVAQDAGKLSFAMAAADNIASGSVTITKGGIVQTQPITIANHTGAISFSNLQVGHWSIEVKLYDADGVVIYEGTGNAVVGKDQTTTATVQVNHNTGNLEIIVEVPAAALAAMLAYTYQGNIRRINTDGTGLLQLTQVANGYVQTRDYSRVNHKYLLYRYENGTHALCSMNENGGAVQQLSTHFATFARWSPDAGKIAMETQNQGEGMKIRVMNADGTGEVVISAETETMANMPCWTADGRVVYWNGSSVVICSADGQNRQSFAYDHPVYDCSADNKLLVLTRGDNYNSLIASMNLDGTGFQQLTFGAYGTICARFSPDGRQIAYICSENSSANGVHVMNADGSNDFVIPGTSNPTYEPICFVY